MTERKATPMGNKTPELKEDAGLTKCGICAAVQYNKRLDLWRRDPETRPALDAGEAITILDAGMKAAASSHDPFITLCTAVLNARAALLSRQVPDGLEEIANDAGCPACKATGVKYQDDADGGGIEDCNLCGGGGLVENAVHKRVKLFLDNIQYNDPLYGIVKNLVYSNTALKGSK